MLAGARPSVNGHPRARNCAVLRPAAAGTPRDRTHRVTASPSSGRRSPVIPPAHFEGAPIDRDLRSLACVVRSARLSSSRGSSAAPTISRSIQPAGRARPVSRATSLAADERVDLRVVADGGARPCRRRRFASRHHLRRPSSRHIFGQPNPRLQLGERSRVRDTTGGRLTTCSGHQTRDGTCHAASPDCSDTSVLSCGNRGPGVCSMIGSLMTHGGSTLDSQYALLHHPSRSRWSIHAHGRGR